eukprot:g23313.t1
MARQRLAAALHSHARCSILHKSACRERSLQALAVRVRGIAAPVLQLHWPGLEDFFLHALGGLPLSVQLCGQMLKVGHLDSVAQLLAAFPKKPLEETDKDGSYQGQVRHYNGLVGSVMVLVARLRQAEQHSEAERAQALALLMCLSVLPRSETPLSLFQQKDQQDVVPDQQVTAAAAMFLARPQNTDRRASKGAWKDRVWKHPALETRGGCCCSMGCCKWR